MPLLYAIGLGGTGSSIVLKFVEKFKSVISEAQESGVGVGVKVQIIDLAKEPVVDDAVKSGLLAPDDVFVVPAYLVEQEKSYLPVLADSKPWFPKELKGDLLYRVRGEHGVERRRPVARLLFHSPQIAWSIYNVLKRDIEELVKMREAMGINVIYVAIIASLGGGWGSGTLIDIAALVRQIIYRVAGEALTPIIIGIFVLPYGYSTRPPPGIRVEFEEENAIAALKELYLLHLYHKYGIKYSEEIQQIGEVVYSSANVKLFDIVFLASYGNVLGGTYIEQFERLDSAIADFLAFLALMPSTPDELKRMEKIVSGLSLSENILLLYNEADRLLPLPKAEEIELFRYRPIVATFGIAEYDIDLKTLYEYFDNIKQSQEIEQRISELEKQVNEIEKKLTETRVKLTEAQTKFRDCLERATRLLRGEEVYTPPKSIENMIEDEIKRIDQDPIGYDKRRDILKFIDRVKSEVGRNITLLYLVLRLLEQKLRELEISYGEELSKIEESIKIKERELEANLKALENLSMVSRVLRKDREYRENIKRLQEELRALRNRSSVLREKVDGIRINRDDISSQISTIASSARADDLCTDLAKTISDYDNDARNIEVDLKRLTSELNSMKKIYDDIMKNLDKLKQNPTLIKLRTEFGEALLNALMDQWRKDPQNFTKLTLDDIRKIIENQKINVDIFDKAVSKLSLNAKPLLIDSPETRKCYSEFYSHYLKGQISNLTTGSRIVVATPRDVTELSNRIGSTFSIKLSYLGANAKLVVLNPVIPLPCTEEFRGMYSEYRNAIDMGAYYIHILPVNRMVKQLEDKIKEFQTQAAP
ncbi:MAG: tubulin-like doman-containing protein [Ignisphaera sp.]